MPIAADAPGAGEAAVRPTRSSRNTRSSSSSSRRSSDLASSWRCRSSVSLSITSLKSRCASAIGATYHLKKGRSRALTGAATVPRSPSRRCGTRSTLTGQRRSARSRKACVDSVFGAPRSSEPVPVATARLYGCPRVSQRSRHRFVRAVWHLARAQNSQGRDASTQRPGAGVASSATAYGPLVLKQR